MAEPWTDAEVELLRYCLTKGMSYGQMLPLFPGKARNALIGKAHRKGFHRLVVGAPKPVATPPKPVQASFKGFKLQMMPDEPALAPLPSPPTWAAPPAEAEPAAPEPSQPASSGVLLMALREHHCRWPLNDGGPFIFCGERKAPKSAYCEHHRRLAIPKASERRKPYVPPKISTYKLRTGR